MNRTPDIDLVLREYLADDGLRAPDYVLDVVESRISRQRQRRAWPFPGRTNVTTQIKLIAALAAALVVAVVGYNLLPGTSGPGGPTTAPTPSAQPTPSVTAAASASAQFPDWWSSDGPPTGAGIMQAGSHATTSFRPGFTFSVPEGWVNDGDEDGYFSLFRDTPANEAEFARSGGMAQSMVMGPRNDPYFYCDAVEDNYGATAAEIAAAVTANEALATTGLVDVEMGGLTGKQLDVRLNPEWTGTCPASPDDPPGLNLGDQRTRGILLDSDRGVIVIFIGSLTSADFEAFLAEAMPIVESFQFDLGQ
jgi:hypothetical protein